MKYKSLKRLSLNVLSPPLTTQKKRGKNPLSLPSGHKQGEHAYSLFHTGLEVIFCVSSLIETPVPSLISSSSFAIIPEFKVKLLSHSAINPQIHQCPDPYLIQRVQVGAHVHSNYCLNGLWRFRILGVCSLNWGGMWGWEVKSWQQTKKSDLANIASRWVGLGWWWWVWVFRLKAGVVRCWAWLGVEWWCWWGRKM